MMSPLPPKTSALSPAAGGGGGGDGNAPTTTKTTGNCSVVVASVAWASLWGSTTAHHPARVAMQERVLAASFPAESRRQLAPLVTTKKNGEPPNYEHNLTLPAGASTTTAEEARKRSWVTFSSSRTARTHTHERNERRESRRERERGVGANWLRPGHFAVSLLSGWGSRKPLLPEVSFLAHSCSGRVVPLLLFFQQGSKREGA